MLENRVKFKSGVIKKKNRKKKKKKKSVITDEHRSTITEISFSQFIFIYVLKHVSES